MTDIPAFIHPDERGYRFWAAHEIRYPKLDIGCRDADPALGLQMAALISEQLPQGVFYFMSYAPYQLEQSRVATNAIQLFEALEGD